MRNTGSRLDATRLLGSSVATLTSCVIVNSPPAARASGPARRASGESDTFVVGVAVSVLGMVAIGGTSFDNLEKDRFQVLLLPSERDHGGLRVVQNQPQQLGF